MATSMRRKRSPVRKPKTPRMVLTGADRDAFLAALLDPPAPAAKLVAALKRHRRLRALAEAAEDLADIRACDRAKKRLAEGKSELVPIEMYDRIAAGENRVRVWREHRGLKLNALAARAGIKPPFLSQIETGRRTASRATMKALARALGVGVDDLVG